MVSFRRLAFLLVIALPAAPAVLAQSSSSSLSNLFANPFGDPDQASGPELAQNSPGDASRQAGGESQGEISVQERIRQRRALRRSTAIHDAYDHLFETYMDMGYLRFQPGPNLQRLTYYAWETGLTRFYSERLGYTLDGRGYFGTAFVGLNLYSQGQFTRPAVSQYDVLFGPVYRFYLQPRFAISGRAMGGWAHGNFSGDTNGIPPTDLGLYPDANTYAGSVSIIGELNISPGIALKLVPEYFFTGFGSSFQASRGFTGGLVYRFGKQ